MKAPVNPSKYTTTSAPNLIYNPNDELIGSFFVLERYNSIFNRSNYQRRRIHVYLLREHARLMPPYQRGKLRQELVWNHLDLSRTQPGNRLRTGLASRIRFYTVDEITMIPASLQFKTYGEYVHYKRMKHDEWVARYKLRVKSKAPIQS